MDVNFKFVNSLLILQQINWIFGVCLNSQSWAICVDLCQKKGPNQRTSIGPWIFLAGLGSRAAETGTFEMYRKAPRT